MINNKRKSRRRQVRYTAWLVLDDLAARRRAAVVLQESNAQLDARVTERTAELAAANERLTVENL